MNGPIILFMLSVKKKSPTQYSEDQLLAQKTDANKDVTNCGKYQPSCASSQIILIKEIIYGVCDFKQYRRSAPLNFDSVNNSGCKHLVQYRLIVTFPPARLNLVSNKRILVIVLFYSTILKSCVNICYYVFSNALLVFKNVAFMNNATDSLTICKSNIL